VNFEDVVAAGSLMQAIDVLRHDRQAPRGNRFVSRVRIRLRDKLAPPVIPFPHQLRIARECFLGREFLGTERSPQSTRAAERWNPTLG
jgi:hypothetical protein